MNPLDRLDLGKGAQAAFFVSLIIICYYLYAIEKNQRMMLKSTHHQTRGLGNALSAIHQEVRDEDEDEPPEGEADEQVEAAIEATEEVKEQAAEADAGNE